MRPLTLAAVRPWREAWADALYGPGGFKDSVNVETGLVADISLGKAWKADTAGNLIYRKTARNFNPAMATAGKITIAEVEEIVEPGQLDPDNIHTPGIYVQRLICGAPYNKIIENRTVRKRA